MTPDQIETIKRIRQKLRGNLDDKRMLKKDNSYPGLEERGIYTYSVYYSYPTTENKEEIASIIRSEGLTPHPSRVVGGRYGFIISFKIGE